MPGPVIPWEPCNIPEELQAEFNRRKQNRSFKYVEINKGGWDSNTGDWTKYRGPMSPWVRLCSNGKGRESGPGAGKEGFVFFGGKGFYDDYGFNKKGGDPSIIGYVPNKAHDIHTISNDKSADYPIHVPAPEIERISVSIQKELYRRAKVEWICFSKAQLEYMTPYFLVPGITCIMEWGWNHYNPKSLVDITDTQLLENLWNNPYPLYTENILWSKGNYDVIFGFVTNFEWEVDGNKFRCRTEITSKDRIYAGLIVDSNAVDSTNKDDEKETKEKPLNSLVQFIDKSLDKFRNIESTPPDQVEELKKFCQYIRQAHPNNADEYINGVFLGRDPKDKTNTFNNKPNTKDDFDYQQPNANLWLNLGLVIEAINFHTAPADGVKGKEMFRIDIDDVVVSAHPNMISYEGGICLVPNAESPHYHYGKFGKDDRLKECDSTVSVPPQKGAAKDAQKLADWKLQDVTDPGSGVARRDDIDKIINYIRYKKGTAAGSCCFPFQKPVKTLENKDYPPRYSGYLRHIYINVNQLKNLLDNSSDIDTYFKLAEKLLESVNAACGNFWDLRIVNGWGDKKLKKDDLAPMKVIDYKFMYFSNRGKVWTFDYFDADSLLLGIGFKPTMSNAQAIRTIYAPTNNPNNTTTITNGPNELLDYHFKDRLKIGQGQGILPTPNADTSGFDDTMRILQSLNPSFEQFQMTTDTKVRRLGLPAKDVQYMLLDDGDEDNNPKYTGVMPNIQATFTIQGIGGLRTFMMFLVRNLPEPYSHKNIVFRIIDVQETIEAGKWTTTITAGVIPLREHIKARLGITFN